MEEVSSSWPQKSMVGLNHHLDVSFWAFYVLLHGLLVVCYMFFPIWPLALVILALWLLMVLGLVVRLRMDHSTILHLRKLYEDYFDYCYAMKRCKEK